MSENLENAVINALSADATEFKDNILSALSQKVQDALAAKKLEVAKSFFGTQEEENTNIDNSENEETKDEEF